MKSMTQRFTISKKLEGNLRITWTNKRKGLAAGSVSNFQFFACLYVIIFVLLIQKKFEGQI